MCDHAALASSISFRWWYFGHIPYPTYKQQVVLLDIVQEVSICRTISKYRTISIHRIFDGISYPTCFSLHPPASPRVFSMQILIGNFDVYIKCLVSKGYRFLVLLLFIGTMVIIVPVLAENGNTVWYVCSCLPLSRLQSRFGGNLRGI